MIPIERFCHYFNQVLIESGYAYTCMYDQNESNNIEFFHIVRNEVRTERMSIIDPIVNNFNFSVRVVDVDKFFNHFKDRLGNDKKFIHLKKSSEDINTWTNWSIDKHIVGDTISFTLTGGLYRIFLVVLLICESVVISRKLPKFSLGDRVVTNFGKSIIYDYIYDVENDDIEYVCLLSEIDYDPRSFPESSIKFDRDDKIDKILK